MNIDKLVKGIQIIVKDEVKKTLPKIVKEVVKRETSSLRKENKKLRKKINEIASKDTVYGPTGHVNGNDIDESLDTGTFMDDSQSVQENTPKFSSNPIINQVLAETAKGYNPNPNNVPAPQDPQENASNPMINEASGNPEEFEEYPTMNHNMKPQPNGVVGMDGAEAVKAEMKAQMDSQFQGQGGGSGRPNPNGLGVKTGIPSLDRVLNRDNSELVKKMEQQKSQPFRPGSGGNQW